MWISIIYFFVFVFVVVFVTYCFYLCRMSFDDVLPHARKNVSPREKKCGIFLTQND